LLGLDFIGYPRYRSANAVSGCTIFLPKGRGANFFYIGLLCAMLNVVLKETGVTCLLTIRGGVTDWPKMRFVGR